MTSNSATHYGNCMQFLLSNCKINFPNLVGDYRSVRFPDLLAFRRSVSIHPALEPMRARVLKGMSWKPTSRTGNVHSISIRRRDSSSTARALRPHPRGIAKRCDFDAAARSSQPTRPGALRPQCRESFYCGGCRYDVVVFGDHQRRELKWNACELYSRTLKMHAA
jgi:hypothetical protein